MHCFQPLNCFSFHRFKSSVLQLTHKTNKAVMHVFSLSSMRFKFIIVCVLLFCWQYVDTMRHRINNNNKATHKICVIAGNTKIRHVNSNAKNLSTRTRTHAHTGRLTQRHTLVKTFVGCDYLHPAIDFRVGQSLSSQPRNDIQIGTACVWLVFSCE